jgi:hypothetical protein
MRRTILLFAVAALVLVPAVPASGAWGGTLDGNGHPMVGAMYADFNGDSVITWDELVCSGSYAGPSKDGQHQVFLTAGHCVAWTPLEGIDTLWVSFDDDPQEGDGIPEGLISTDEFFWDPRFGHDFGNYYDSAVLLLPLGSVGGGIPAVQLPPPRYLDELKATGELKGMEVELVGYGVVPVWQQAGGTQYQFDGVRRVSTSKVIGLTQAWLKLLQNPNATGLGGLCFGDSGSPQFVPGSLMIVSTTTGGNPNCNANDSNYRLDTPGAQEFLGQFLVLPT